LLKRKWPTRRLVRVALSWRRDRLTAIGRRRSDTAKKKCSNIAKKKYWRAASARLRQRTKINSEIRERESQREGARRWRANRQKVFVSESESERVSGRCCGGRLENAYGTA